MSFATLPRSRSSSPAFKRIEAAGRAFQAAQNKVGADSASGRQIGPVPLPPKFEPARVIGAAPAVQMVAPTDLVVEDAYQRGLTQKGLTLIRRIVANWDWARFKPPICARGPDGRLCVIDGQHTATAAATHPGITVIPVLVVSADQVKRRAASFVAHNRDRVAMTIFQVFRAELVAGNPAAEAIAAAVKRAGGQIPTYHRKKPGDVIGVTEARSIYRRHGADALFKIVRIGCLAGLAPISTHVMRGLRLVVSEPAYGADRSIEEIAAAVASVPDLEVAARRHASETDGRIAGSVATLIAAALNQERTR